MQAVGSQAAPPKGAKVAFRQGLFFGLVLAGINDTLYILNSVFNQTPTATTTNSGAVGAAVLIGFAVGCLIFLLDLGAYFGAGILAARQTAKVSTGTFAGMWAGAIYGLIDFIVKVVIQFTITIPANAQALQSTSPENAQSTANILGIAGIVGAFVLVLAAVGLGAGLGSLGGLIGRNISKVKLPERALVPYPGPLYGMYPPMYSMQGQSWQAQAGMPAYPVPMQPVPGYAPVSINGGYAIPVHNQGPMLSSAGGYGQPFGGNGYAMQAGEGYAGVAPRAQEEERSRGQHEQHVQWEQPMQVSQSLQSHLQQNESKPLAVSLSEQAGRANWDANQQNGEQVYQEHTDDEDRTQRLNPRRSSLP